MVEHELLTATGGVLLAGGLSTRFGAEKAMAQWHGGVLMDAVCARFTALAQIAVSARPGSAAEHHALARGLDVLHDDPAYPSGPLAGVAAGLVWAKRRNLRRVATAPCDTPLLPLAIFPILLSQLVDAPAAFAATSEGPNPLCAIWRTDVLSDLQARLADHHPSVQRFHAELGSTAVRFADATAFANANTKEALAAIEARL
ncbi:MAG: molybdenum cofactor guanylyltransferase [Hyphomonadaceae bacterium]|nr:molybdenum cofactor guanylyltransferase [Hyphomonadaceae bacterium]